MTAGINEVESFGSAKTEQISKTLHIHKENKFLSWTPFFTSIKMENTGSVTVLSFCQHWLQELVTSTTVYAYIE